MSERFQIKGPSGSISAEMLLPRSFDKEHDRCELVILMHGFLGSMKAAPLGFLSRMLVKQGYAVLRFDFDGYGKSDGSLGKISVNGTPNNSNEQQLYHPSRTEIRVSSS